MKTSNSNTSPAVIFPITEGLLDQCSVCGVVGQLGDFATSMVSGKSFCEAHAPELLAEVRNAK